MNVSRIYPDMNINVRRRLPGGRALTVPCTLGLLGPDDEAEAVRAYDDTVSGLTPEIFARTTRENIVRLLNGGGFTVGVRYGGRLISLRSVITEKSWVSETLKDWGLNDVEHNDCALTGFCVVSREFRGNNIQFLSYYFAENLISDSFGSIVTTVSPRNIFSLQNIIGYGFTVISLKKIYDGNLRYVMKKYFGSRAMLWTRKHTAIPLTSYAAQQKALADGLTAYKLVRNGRGFRLLFDKMTAGPRKA